MYHIDHVTQLATVRTEPFNQSSRTLMLPPMWIRGCHKFLTIGPLYNVIVVTPAKETNVPRAFAMPRGFRRSRTSNLHLLIKTATYIS